MTQPNTAEQQENLVPEAEDASPSDSALTQLQEELASTKDRALRALAEVENTRRQHERQREEAVRYAVTAFARDLLNVADNLNRALQSAPTGEENPFVTGIVMTEKELLAVFERHGIRKLDPVGEPFDPNQQQAIIEVPETGQPAGQVVQVIQSGYLLHDRLLRPALVAVAKEGDAAPEEGSGSIVLDA
jgi:molecular chaperone GrpE